MSDHGVPLQEINTGVAVAESDTLGTETRTGHERSRLARTANTRTSTVEDDEPSGTGLHRQETIHEAGRPTSRPGFVQSVRGDGVFDGDLDGLGTGPERVDSTYPRPNPRPTLEVRGRVHQMRANTRTDGPLFIDHSAYTPRKRLRDFGPKFSGKQQDFYSWVARYRLHARIYGFLNALEGDDSIDVRDVDEEDLIDAGYRPKQVFTASDAYLSLLNVCSDDKFTAIIMKHSSPRDAFSAVLHRYRTDSLTAINSLSAKLSSLRMKKGEHPEDFFLRCDELALRFRYLNEPVSDRKLLADYLAGLTKDYADPKRKVVMDNISDMAQVLKLMKDQYDEIEKESRMISKAPPTQALAAIKAKESPKPGVQKASSDPKSSSSKPPPPKPEYKDSHTIPGVVVCGR